LEAASVAGLASTVAMVAAGVEAAEEAVETQCAGLAQRGQFLQAQGVEEWPDGTVTARYGFRHTLYQQVLYERGAVARGLRVAPTDRQASGGGLWGAGGNEGGGAGHAL